MKKEKTYTQEVHYKVTIEGNFKCRNLWEEDLIEDADEWHDIIIDYIYDNFRDCFHNRKVDLIDLKTIEEN